MTGIVVLGAGKSSRMGANKLTMRIREKFLIEYPLETVSRLEASTRILVYGDGDHILAELGAKYGFLTVENKENADGISSSLRVGLKELVQSNTSGVKGALILLADQPLVTEELLDRILGLARTNEKGIVACRYEGTFGPPVYFSSGYFDQIMGLTGDRGAKAIIEANIEDTLTLDFPDGSVDVDTVDDFVAFRKR